MLDIHQCKNMVRDDKVIVYPDNWREFGKRVESEDIDKVLREIIADIPCDSLSYSGGIDSSLLLYYLLEVKGKAKCFSVANGKDHPDLYYSRRGINYYEKAFNTIIPHSVIVRPHLQGNDLVRCFYSYLSLNIKAIIAGDGIDELACGYYAHQSDPCEEVYFDYLRRLQVEHLEPLNSNSGGVRVYLPYCDGRLSSLFYRIPLAEKVTGENRKIIIQRLADGKVPDELMERRKYGFATSLEKVGI